MPTIVLGRDQKLLIDGTVAEGTRELDVAISGKTHDISGPFTEWSSTLVLSSDATIHIVIYGQEIVGVVMQKYNKHPPQHFLLEISGVGSAPFVATEATARQPVDGLVSWDVTMKLWNYA